MASNNLTKWKLNATEVSNILELGGVFNACYKISSVKKSRTALDVQNTKAARKPYQNALRKMGQGRMKHNPNMTDTDRTSCGVTNDNNGYTLSGIANMSPIVTYRSTGDLGGKIIFQDPKTFKTCKPVGQSGMRACFGFYKKGKPIPKEVDCTKTIMTGRCFYNIVFDAEKEGMLFVGYARYYNTRDIVGTVATKFFGNVV